MKPQEFIIAIGQAAKVSMTTSGIPASFTIAEAALESAWGSSQLALQARNLFGVKADKAWTGDVLLMPTREFLRGKWVKVDAKWRRYPDWLSCLADHADFLHSNPRYKDVFKAATSEEFALKIQNAGYATDPDYADKIISITHQYQLQRFDVKAAL